MTMSSKFSKQNRIQPLPPLCAKSPNPSGMWDKPLAFHWLQGFAQWNEPGTPAEISISGLLQLEPDPVNNRWHGRTNHFNTFLELTFARGISGNTFDLEIVLRTQFGVIDTKLRRNVPMRSFDPLETTNYDFGAQIAGATITAAVMA